MKPPIQRRLIREGSVEGTWIPCGQRLRNLWFGNRDRCDRRRDVTLHLGFSFRERAGFIRETRRELLRGLSQMRRECIRDLIVDVREGAQKLTDCATDTRAWNAAVGIAVRHDLPGCSETEK